MATVADYDGAKALETQIVPWPGRAALVKITDQNTYNMAAGLVKQIRTLIAQVKEHHKPIKQATDKAHTEAVAAEKRMLEPLHRADATVTAEITRWDVERERERKESQAKADAEARRLADLAATAEAKAAKANGADQKVVDAILAAPVPVPTPIVPPTYDRAEGMSTRQTWHAEVVDIIALCRAVAEGKASTELVLPNMPNLNKLASAMKTTFNIPGVRAVPKTSLAVKVGSARDAGGYGKASPFGPTFPTDDTTELTF